MKKVIKLFLICSLVLGFASCEKFLDKNENPNLVTDPPINGLLAKNTFKTGSNVQQVGDITSYYMQYLSSTNAGSDRDTYNAEDLSVTWDSLYNVMMDIEQMNSIALDKGSSQHLGVGKLLEAINLNMLINMFGDVPFSEAFKGKDVLLPTYDNQQSLHAVSLQLLDEAIIELNKTDSKLNLGASSDAIHGGDVSAWIKTAYALKARFLNQLSKTANYNAGGILEALDNAYTSNNDDAALQLFKGRSPWNEVAYNNTQNLLDGWLSDQFVDALNGKTFGLVDPRLPKIATITQFGDYRGTPNGKGRIGTGTNDEESYLSLDGFYSKNGAPLLMVTYAEIKFIEAEAAFRSGNVQRAYDAYLAGIRAHMEKLGVSAADINTYINNPAVSTGAGNISLALIFKEKYVAMFLHPEAWVDGRRSDYQYKDFGLPVGTVLSTFIRRAAYPVIETSRNGANVPDVSGLDQKLWWDQ